MIQMILNVWVCWLDVLFKAICLQVCHISEIQAVMLEKNRNKMKLDTRKTGTRLCSDAFWR